MRMTGRQATPSIAGMVAVVSRIAGYAFLLWFVPTLHSVVAIPVILVFALVYLAGVRAISRWLHALLARADD
ncbi:MAG: hypothetical protein M3Q51_07985 [Pseudomonadota bacterium]|nr:hypothetical protein [Pseudomonadota bacterium]